MTKHAALTLAPLFLALVGCTTDARWERSRGEYCHELELLANRASPGVAALESTVTAAGNEPVALRTACARARGELREVAAMLTGVRVATDALARARPDAKSVEEAGFHLLRADVVQKFDAIACEAGESQKAAEELAAIKVALDGELKQALDRCQAVGWKSSLADSRYK